ncbi:MAG: ABC transporter permease [Mycobacteriaceae bacterium]|uniref:ABC transporter permease n=1 Tax=Corynebacterium sp. TaxID=1720 RepID=UPI003F97A638
MSTPVASQSTIRARYRLPKLGVPLSVAVSGAIAFVLLVAAIAPSLLATHSPSDISLESPLAAPSTEHWLGTDAIGRDLYSRIIHGTQTSLLIGALAMLLALVLAIILGFASSLGPKWIASVVDRLLEVLLAFPVLLLSLLFVALLGPSATSLVIAVGIGSAPGYARLIRAQGMRVRNSSYVEAARALGHSRRVLFTQHIFPNAFRPLVALVSLGIGQSVVWASGLSFLGLGVAPPSPEWGALLNAGKGDIATAWWLVIMPGLAIAVTALVFTQIGRFIQDRSEGISQS